MLTLILAIMVVLYVFSALFLIVVILGQEGKGGGLSGLVGASALGDTLGASGAENTLRRWTRNCAIMFIVLSMGLTIVGAHVFSGSSSILDAGTVTPAEETNPPPEETTGPVTAPGGPGRAKPIGSMVIPAKRPAGAPAAGAAPVEEGATPGAPPEEPPIGSFVIPAQPLAPTPAPGATPAPGVTPGPGTAAPSGPSATPAPAATPAPKPPTVPVPPPSKAP
jgi:protein translocase SecG subunit